MTSSLGSIRFSRAARAMARGIILLGALDAAAAISPQSQAVIPPADPLKSAVPAVRRKGANDLARSGAADALPRLAELVRDPDPEVRLAVLRSIASLRDLAGVPSMIVFMLDSEVRLRSAAIDGVVEIYTHRDRPGGVSRFLSIFSDGRDKPEPLVVSAVDFEVYRSIAALLKDSDAGVRESAAEAIGILGGTEVAIDLVNALRDSVPNVRSAAVSAIAKAGTSADGEALVPVIRDTNGGVRKRAIAALGRLKVNDAAPELRRVYNSSPDPDERILALGTLAQLSLAEDRVLFQRLAAQADPRRRKAALEGLGRLNDKSSESLLKRGFQREKDEDLRVAYAFAIFSLGDRPFIDTVILGLAGSRDRNRQSRGYLEELGARSLPEALDYLKEGDPKVRAGLCDALANAGVTEAAGAVEPLIKDADTQVRTSAVRAVGLLRRQK